MYIHEREIWLVDLEPSKGIEIQKIRPCLVLRKYSKTHFLIAPITSKEKSDQISYKISNISCLKMDINYINIAHIRSVDSIRFIRKFGKVSHLTFQNIKTKTVEVLQLLPQEPSGHNS